MESTENYTFPPQSGPNTLPNSQVEAYNEQLTGSVSKFRNTIFLMFIAQLGLIFFSRLLEQEIEIPAYGKIEWELPLQEKTIKHIYEILFSFQFTLLSLMLTLNYLPFYKPIK